MIHIFKVNGFPSRERPYIFNGDVTDRGDMGLECLLGLLLIKRYCNECMHIHLGNHETAFYYTETLKEQVLKLYDFETYKMVRDVIVRLPLAAVVDDRIYVVHGGIPSSDFMLDDLRHYKRGHDIDYKVREGYLFGRSVWSDPDNDEDDAEDDDHVDNKTDEERAARRSQFDFEIEDENDDARGWYSPDTTKTFLERNNLEYLVRAHQNVAGGFRYHHDNRVITIHSNPRNATQIGAYLNVYSNDGSMNIQQFSGVKFSSIDHQSKVDWRSL